MTQSSLMIEVVDLVKRFGDHTAVDTVSFSVNQGAAADHFLLIVRFGISTTRASMTVPVRRLSAASRGCSVPTRGSKAIV